MSYENPILLIQQRMNAQIEDAVCKAVQKVGIYVDKDELIKALKYDREQYQKGYKDRDDQIVRCNDCKHWDSEEHECSNKIGWFYCDEEWFCADGEKE